MGRLTIPDVVPALRAYYTKPENRNGGSLHIVTEDANIAHDHVLWCARYAREHNDSEGERLAEMIASLTISQRRRLTNQYYSAYCSGDLV